MQSILSPPSYRSIANHPRPSAITATFASMGWLILVVLVVGGLVLYIRSSLRKPDPVRPPQRHTPPLPTLAEEERRIRREIDAEVARLQPEIEAEAARIHADAMREAEAAFEAIQAEPVEEPPRRVIWREDYVSKDEEARYLTRDENGLPTVRLADAGDRLGIWSPLDGGALINPKGPGLRQCLGLCTSYARGSGHYASAYRAADLSYGRWVDLKREPENVHDKNAVAMCTPGSRVPFGYVGRGRAVSVARRMDAGEDMAGVTIWGPGRGSDDRSTLVLIGSRADLSAMLENW